MVLNLLICKYRTPVLSPEPGSFSGAGPRFVLRCRTPVRSQAPDPGSFSGAGPRFVLRHWTPVRSQAPDPGSFSGAGPRFVLRHWTPVRSQAPDPGSFLPGASLQSLENDVRRSFPMKRFLAKKKETIFANLLIGSRDWHR